MMASEPEAARVLVELGGIVLFLALLARISHRYGLSPIPAYLLAGVLARAWGGFRPLLADSFVATAGRIGVVLLLLTLGLEYTGEELWHSLRRRWPAGLVDLAANFLPGAFVAWLLGWSAAAAVILGGITYISSSGVVAKVLADLGRLGNRETPAVLSILVIEDLAMAAYLPLVVLLVVGGRLSQALASVALALAATLIVLTVAIRFGPPLSRLLFTRTDEALLLSVFGLALLVSGVAELLEVSAAIGAFLLGIAISGPVQERASSLVGPLRDLFAATFFFVFGMQIDYRSVAGVMGTAFLLALISSLTKVATGWWAAAREGVGFRGRLRAGTALVARGEFSIVIAGLVLGGRLEPELVPLAGGYVLLMATVGPLLTRFADPLADVLGGRVARGPVRSRG